MDMLDDDKRTIQQLSLNCKWLISKIDHMHVILCPDKLGTWQQRAEQVLDAVLKLPKPQ
jgi:hypothetical protein